MPHESRNFRSLSQPTFFMNGSLITRHANAADGKMPHWLSGPNFDEPSRRTLPVSRYLSFNERFARPKNDTSRLSCVSRNVCCVFDPGMPLGPRRSVLRPTASARVESYWKFSYV